MFAKTATSNIASGRRTAASSPVLAHSKNAVIARAGLCRACRPKLVCRPVTGSRLACRPHIKPADGVATEAPDQRWISVHGHLVPALRRQGGRLRRGPASLGRLNVPAARMNSET